MKNYFPKVIQITDMGERLSTYVDEEETAEFIDDFADHHDISRSKAISILIHEGIDNRNLRYHLEVIDAKVELLLETLGEENRISEKVTERLAKTKGKKLPTGSEPEKMRDRPMEAMLPESDYK